MKIRLLPFAFLMALLMSACSDKDNDNGTNKGDTKTVFLQLKTFSGGTRANLPSATDTSADILSAIIYFMNSNGVVYDVRTVGAGGADVPMDQFEGGYQFEDIPSSVSMVYVVGNYNSSDSEGNAPAFPVNTGTTLAQIQAIVLNIEQVAHGALADGQGTTYSGLLTVMDGQANVVMYGDNPDDWQGDPDLTDDDYYAEVELIPVNSRIEIEEISYEGNLISFTLEGIYINYYYPNAPLSLDLDGFPYTNNGSDVNAYDIASDDFAYTDYMTLFNIVNIPMPVETNGGEASAIPSNGTWAYHVFGNSNPVPHIILKLTNVVAPDGTTLGNRYVTVTGFRNNATGAEITTFERNTIYKITNLAFTSDDIDVLPETETINIWVHVTVREWETIEVTPII